MGLLDADFGQPYAPGPMQQKAGQWAASMRQANEAYNQMMRDRAMAAMQQQQMRQPYTGQTASYYRQLPEVSQSVAPTFGQPPRPMQLMPGIANTPQLPQLPQLPSLPKLPRW